MLHSVNQMTEFSIAATDGDLGTIDSVYFDDANWTIRYLVIDTGRWLSGRQVLISPISVRKIDWRNKTLHLALTRQQIENSPDVDTDKPVSRQHEADLNDHYGYPYYWTGPFVWGATAFPEAMAAQGMQNADARRDMERHHEPQPDENPHLRSCKEVTGYRIRATDDAIGHVEDFLFNEENWSIELIVIDPRNWWPGKHVMVSPQRIDRIDWAEQQVVVNLTRDEVEHSPEYDAVDDPALDKRQGLYRHFSGPPS